MEVSQPLDHITHAVIGGGQTIDFGISNSAEFFDILSRTLYKDQILAVVREVLCNAWDAHIAAGITDKPIQIFLDSEHFIVTDFGLGIKHTDIGPIYGVYGASTKKANPNETGGFGLGCKAPFAYTEHFEVTSAHDGKKTIYNMSKSNAVAKGKPGIITLASFPSEEQGLRVKIPILMKDWRRYEDLIRRIVANGEILATLNNEPLKTYRFSECQHNYMLSTYRMLDTGHDNDRILLRYGNVIYPVERTEEIKHGFDTTMEFLKQFKEHRLVLQAPPDSISVTPSRESLSMQEHTIVTLNKLFRRFLDNVKGLDEEIAVQARDLTQKSVGTQGLKAVFADGWAFPTITGSAHQIKDMFGMARYQLSQAYPANVGFRIKDIDLRLREAIKLKLVDPKMTNSFLDDLPTVSALPPRHGYYNSGTGTDWLQREVARRFMGRIVTRGLDAKSLFVFDRSYASNLYRESGLIPVLDLRKRNQLYNLPYLRRTVIITTAITGIYDRINRYANLHPGAPRDNMLCYYVRTRKAGAIEAAFEFFKKFGYEIIDLSNKNTWENREVRVPTPRKKAADWPGLPALSNTMVKGEFNVSRFQTADAVLLPKPELVLVVPAVAVKANQLPDFENAAAARALVTLYGNRLGLAKDQLELKRAKKAGSKDLIEVIEEEMQLIIMTSPAVAEYMPFEFERIEAGLDYRQRKIVRLIYREPELRQAFGLVNNMSAEESAMVKLFWKADLPVALKKTIKDYINTLPVSPLNKKVLDAITGNELISMLDVDNIKIGLSSAKRQVCIDVLLQVLKG